MLLCLLPFIFIGVVTARFSLLLSRAWMHVQSEADRALQGESGGEGESSIGLCCDAVQQQRALCTMSIIMLCCVVLLVGVDAIWKA